MAEKKSRKNPPTNPAPTESSEGSIRLNRFLAMAGIASRRSCDSLIMAGRVSVNEETVTRLGVRIDPERDRVRFDGEPVKIVERRVYILLHKPLRTVTTVKDDRGRRTVVELIGVPERIFPVGRLDYDSSGALLLTNDGDLSYYLIHPRFEVKKVYRVTLNRIIRPVDLHHFQHGVALDGSTTAPCKAREIRRLGDRSLLEVELHEGRNRQIRRMFEILGYHVEELHRLIFAGLSLTGLNQGEWRELAPKEVKELRRLVDEQREGIVAESRSSAAGSAGTVEDPDDPGD